MALSRDFSAMFVSSNESHLGRPRSVSSTDSQSSSGSFASQTRGMPIHSRRSPYTPPPPLPPPQYIPELDRGRDICYEHASHVSANTIGLPPIPETSSLSSGTFPRPRQIRHFKQSMDLDDESTHMPSSSSLIQPAHSEGGAYNSKMSRRAHSPSSSSTRLQGEYPLAQVSHDQASRDYDSAMLSKIGKPNSPPRPSRADSSDSPVLAQKLSLQIKDINKNNKPSANEPSSAVASVTPWVTSPSSTGMSPGARYGWHDQNGLRSPPIDGGPNTSVLDPELFVQSRPTSHQTGAGAYVRHDEPPNRSARNSYDQAAHTPAESEPAENPALRGLNADEVSSSQRRTSATGMKRKAPSPPDDRQSEERSRQDMYPLRMRVASKSPNMGYPSTNGSLSSAASSVPPQSYPSSSGPFSAPSSGPFSAAASITSMSSFDPNSPRESVLPPTYINNIQPLASPVISVAPRKGAEKATGKLSLQTTALSPRPIPTRIGNNYICACCPKKPRKFETEEQLRQHESEKQYSCNFCHNRFKNKNEAERHQNSLHLRRHSWSCAALADYQAAFSPSGAVDSASTATDACGYCGEEFPNHPAIDWDRRLEHLTNVHKFGECNSAKKFYRADHFRQHLKHSHGGRSGKWTNILEHACVRDEIPPESAGFSASMGDHNPGVQGRGSTGLRTGSDIAVGMPAARGSQDDGAST